MLVAPLRSDAGSTRCLPFVFIPRGNGRKSTPNSWLDLTEKPLGRVKFAGQRVIWGGDGG